MLIQIKLLVIIPTTAGVGKPAASNNPIQLVNIIIFVYEDRKLYMYAAFMAGVVAWPLLVLSPTSDM
jgi:hypothetical protein